MNVLSLFDGISCAYEGCSRADIQIKQYYACEIDPYAIKISQQNHPDIIRPINDVRYLTKQMLPDIDLLIGGSPCQDLSIAKKDRKGLAGERSGLFWEYVRILKEVKPKWFILENVASMPKADKDLITETLGVEPIMFNASLVSAQNRKRLFWTNISFALPSDKGILLKDILQPDAEVDERMITKDNVFKHSIQQKNTKIVKIGHIGDKERQTTRVYSPDGKAPTLLKGSAVGGALPPLIKLGNIGNGDSQANRVYSIEGKSSTLSANGGGGGAKTGLYAIEGNIRKLTPIECERLQGLPDNYTAGISNTQRYRCLGNAFNVDVIAHILIHTV